MHLVPDAALLFHFSALTMNAHAIHLDRAHCRETEGYRNLLVHGPLSLFLMLEVLGRYLRRPSQGALSKSSYAQIGSQEIVRIEYRNLAKLYADEEMIVCVRPVGVSSDDGRQVLKWQVWIENSDGSLAVNGTVVTRSRKQ